jgi:tetratricopeptide (TPR) repeat protein/predicted Ser/Thr protein kinase
MIGNRYRIIRVLGEGGMGTVYQARDLELERLIALKVIRPELASNPGILQRFKQELILARHVTHKNVVRIYDLGEADGIKFITMEYVEGDDLRSLLREHGKFSPSESSETVQQICRALDAAHAEGIIHRDLKPQNVMRDRQGRIVVMDFGLARSLESPGMTQTGALVGTLEYMSPEQALGKEIDQRSDIFATGLIFYELLTGKAPYEAPSGIATLMKRTQEAAPAASDTDANVPVALSVIVSRCLERDPSHRFQSAQELIEAIDGWQARPTASAAAARPATAASGPRSVQISINMPGRQAWMWVAGLALLVVVLLAVPAVRNRLFRPAARQNPAAVAAIPALSQGKYLAVFPLGVTGDEKSLRYVADGLVDALSAKMFQLHEVHVASSTAVEKVADKNQGTTDAARALGVNLILQGRVQGTPEKFRITLDLENISDGRRMWTQEFSGVPQDLLTIEDQIYNALVQALDLRPSDEETARSGVHPTENIAAYDLYLKGRSALRNTKNTTDTQSAIRYLEQALGQDSNFALAYAGLADANLAMYKDTKDPLYAQKALATAQQADRLNDSLPEVHLALGSVYNATGRTAQAVEELKRALALSPNSDEAYARLGDAYLTTGRKPEAVSAYESAIRANPYYWYNHNKLARAYLVTGENERALSEYQRVIELAADNPTGYENTATVYIRQGKYAEAIPALEKAVAARADGPNYSNLGTAYFFVKRYKDAVTAFEKAVQLTPNDEQIVGNLADAYRWAGNSQLAVATYDKAIRLAYQQLQINPKSANVTGDLAVYYAKKGDSAHAIQYIRQARSIDPSDLQLIYYEAQVYTLAQKNGDAMSALRQAFQKGYSPEEAQNDPELQNINQLPEFAKLISEFSRKSK